MSDEESNLPVIWTGIGLTVAAALGIVVWMWAKSAGASDTAAQLDACKQGQRLACATLCSATPS
ncbi:MAG TPA: hypothetical protein PKA88_31010, partial [Polyangiaceae bacterium]|nr:hypothetical protein [Polyangiaceae bacterium]